MALALYGWFGAPLTAAVYLGLHLRPRAQGARALIPVAAATLLLALLFVLTLAPAVNWLGTRAVRESHTIESRR